MPSSLAFGGPPSSLPATRLPFVLDEMTTAVNANASELHVLRHEAAGLLITSLGYAYGLTPAELDEAWHRLQQGGALAGVHVPSRLIEICQVMFETVRAEPGE